MNMERQEVATASGGLCVPKQLYIKWTATDGIKDCRLSISDNFHLLYT